MSCDQLLISKPGFFSHFYTCLKPHFGVDISLLKVQLILNLTSTVSLANNPTTNQY